MPPADGVDNRPRRKIVETIAPATSFDPDAILRNRVSGDVGIMSGAYDDSVARQHRSIAGTPTWTGRYRILVAALARL